MKSYRTKYKTSMNKPILSFVKAEFDKMFGISQLVCTVCSLMHDFSRKDKISDKT